MTKRNICEPIDWLSTGEAVELLGVPLRTLYRLIDEGEVPAYKFGRVIRLQHQQVVDYRNRRGTATRPGD